MTSGHRPREDDGRPASPMVSRAAKVVTTALGIALLLPTLLIGLQPPGMLTEFHNRSLAPWPGLVGSVASPQDYFAGANRWLSDRIFPIMAVSRIKNQLTYDVLGEPPSPNITIGRDGLTFLNGTDAANPDNLITHSCIEAAAPADLARLEAALRRFAAFGRQRDVPVDVLMVPTIPILYGDRIPRSVSSRIRKACAALYAQHGPVSTLRIPDGLRFTYPFAELAASRDDFAMYPNGNYHASGLAVRLATQAYLRAIGAAGPDVPLALTLAPSEVLAGQGVQALFPRYAVTQSDATTDDALAAELTEVAAPYRDDPGQVVTLYRNPQAPDPGTVLLLTDSFGTNQAADLALVFRTVAQMQSPHRDITAMIDRFRDMIRFDRIVLVYNDTNVIRLSEVGERLSLPDGR